LFRKRVFATLIGFLVVAAACGDDAAETTTTTAATTTAPTTTTVATTTTTAAPVSLLIWADENRANVLNEIVPAFTEATGVEVTVEIVDFGEIRGQVQVAGPAGEGPDIFVGAHDWTGELAANGVVEPVDLGGRTDEWFPVAIDSFSFGGSLFAVPYATEAIAMYYNMDLVPTAPATFEEIGGICDSLAGITNCVGIPGGGDGADAYHNFPFVSALGGYIFAYDAETGYDPTDVGLDSAEAVAGVEFLADQVAAGVIGSTNYEDAKNLFLEGTEPFWITGPWELGDLNTSGMNYGVAKLPTIGGNTPKPFVGAQGFFVSAFSENKLVAQSFLLDFVATSETMLALYEIDPRNPAFVAAFDEISDDAIAATFALSAADGLPMPNIPEMGNVWGPLGDNLLAVRNGTLDAAAAMATAAAAVRDAIG